MLNLYLSERNVGALFAFCFVLWIKKKNKKKKKQKKK